MLWSEPITNIFWYKNPCIHSDDSYIKLFYDLEFYTCQNDALVFKTKTKYITVGCNGIELWDDIKKFTGDEDNLIDLSEKQPFVLAEHTIFSGQHITNVKYDKGCYTVYFDDFSMRIVKYETNDCLWFHKNHKSSSYTPIYAIKHKLTQKCSCGGCGEAFIDFVDDYIIRCNKCHKSTWASFELETCINAWNSKDTPTYFDTDDEIFTSKYSSSDILSISVSSKGFHNYDDDLIDTESIILSFPDSHFLVSFVNLNDNTCDLCLSKISEYNKNLYNRIIYPETGVIRFIGFPDDKTRKMLLMIDNTYLLITPCEDCLMVGFTNHSINGLWSERKRNKLFTKEP